MNEMAMQRRSKQFFREVNLSSNANIRSERERLSAVFRFDTHPIRATRLRDHLDAES
ncbi:MAG: hypothetical protein AB7J28_10760 [Hyphomonadaceae bacterium]